MEQTLTQTFDQAVAELDTEPAGSDAMMEMLGLRGRGVRIAVAATVVVYVFIGLALPKLDISTTKFVVSIIGSIGLVLALIASASGRTDPIGLPRTITAVVLGAASGSAVWWTIPLGVGNWVRPGAPMVVFAVAMCLLIVRGRVRWAWAGFVLVIGLCVYAVIVWEWQSGIGLQVLLRMFFTLVPATLIMFFMRPLLRFVRVLDLKEVAAVEAEAASSATAEQRRVRLLELERDVQPLLEQAAEGGELSPSDMERARLLEAALRDEVRGRTLVSPGVRRAVARARETGIAVSIFDDTSPDELDFASVEPIRAELISALGEVRSGSIVARLLPSGRDAAATITHVDGTYVNRRVCRSLDSGGAAWEYDNDGATLK